LEKINLRGNNLFCKPVIPLNVVLQVDDSNLPVCPN